MTDPNEALTENLTDSELRAISYFAIGVGSEGVEAGVDISNRLSFAGNIRNEVMAPVGNSGLSIGTLQTDLGQHPDVAPALVGAYQTWATAHRPEWVLTDAQRDQTIGDLSRNGRTIVAQGGRTIDATVKDRLDTFLSSDDGINYVHSNDLREVDKLMSRVMPRLQQTSLYENATTEDKIRMATVVAKAYNQSELWGGRILDRVQDDYAGANRYASLADIKQAIKDLPDGRGEYMRTGRDAALEGAGVFISLKSMDEVNPMHQAWQNVLSNPLINPTQTGHDTMHPNLSSEYTAVKGLFLQKSNASALIEALDRGGAYGHDVTNSRGQSRPQSTSLYVSGDDFVVMEGRGIGKAYVAGAWSDVDRANLTRVDGGNGTLDLNISRDGATERLLHIDPDAPLLRPAPRSAEPAQPAAPTTPTNRQDWGPFTPTQVPAVVPVLAPPGSGSSPRAESDERQQSIDADRAPSNAITPTTAPAISPALPMPAADERERDERERREQDPQTSIRGPFADPVLDRYHAAVLGGKSDVADGIANEFAQSPEGQRMAQTGDQLLAQQQMVQRQQAQEQQVAQAQIQQGPVMRL